MTIKLYNWELGDIDGTVEFSGTANLWDAMTNPTRPTYVEYATRYNSAECGQMWHEYPTADECRAFYAHTRSMWDKGITVEDMLSKHYTRVREYIALFPVYGIPVKSYDLGYHTVYRVVWDN